MPFKKSRFTVGFSLEKEAEEWIVLYQTMTRAVILLPEATWSYILSNPLASTDPGTTEMLQNQGFIVEHQTDEAVVFESWRQRQVHDFDTLKSKVLVTRKCNNGCRYCILDPEAKEMTHDTVLAMDRFYIETIKAKHPQSVEDDYLGGEPLLNKKTILESAGRRYYYCRGRGIAYGFVITTNGTLIHPADILAMKDVGLKGIRVSMAGPASVHDNLRPSKNGEKTYQLILKNLAAISGTVPIFVECQYDSGTQDYLKIPEMIDDFSKREILLEDMTFTPILSKRGRSTFQQGAGDPRIFLFLVKEARKYGYCQDWDAPHNACMSDLRSNLVFDTDGSIIPCPSLQGGEMAYGHVTTGIDFVAEAQFLQRRYPDKCLQECAFLPMCMGGCRLQALTKKKTFGGVDCLYETYRVLLEDYLRAQAVQVPWDQNKADNMRSAA